MKYSELFAEWSKPGEAYPLPSPLPPVYLRSREREAECRAIRERSATPLERALEIAQRAASVL